MCMTSSLPLNFAAAPLPYREENSACNMSLTQVCSPIATNSKLRVSNDCRPPSALSTCCGDPSPRKRPRTSTLDVPLPLQSNKCSTPRDRFSAFVSILLMQLDGGNSKDYKLSIQAKALVAECIRRSEMQDPHFLPFEQSMSQRLRALVGDYHWNKAMANLQYYLAKYHGNAAHVGFPAPGYVVTEEKMPSTRDLSVGDAPLPKPSRR